MARTIKSYKETENEFEAFFQEYIKANPLKKEYATKEFIDIIFEFMQKSKCLEQAKEWFEKHHITSTIMKTVVNKTAEEIKTEFMNGNICFVPSLGFYGLTVKKNTKRIGVRNFRIAHYRICYNPFTLKVKYYTVTISPPYHTFCKTCFNILNNPAIMP